MEELNTEDKRGVLTHKFIYLHHFAIGTRTIKKNDIYLVQNLVRKDNSTLLTSSETKIRVYGKKH